MNKKGLNKKTAKVCSYRTLGDEEEGIAVKNVFSSVGGLIVSEQTLPKRKFISKIYSSICDVSIKPSLIEVPQDC